MMDSRNIEIGRPLQPLGNGRSNGSTLAKETKAGNGGQASFDQVLNQAIDTGGLKFSRHALERIESRNLDLSSQRINLIEQAVARADAKGSKESLIIMKDLALVVSVRNKTVITAIDPEGMKGNVFTNIDSAVVMD